MASANYLVVRELLRRGVEIDFYANREHVPPPPGLDTSFRYLGFKPPALPGMLPLAGQRLANHLLSPAVRAAWRQVYTPTAEERHLARPYDAVLSLGTPPAFTIPGVPTVTWLQGPRQTELEAIMRLRRQMCRVSGWPFFLALVGSYLAGQVLDRSVLETSDHVVCGSRWARAELIREGLPAARVHALPYPIDLQMFRPGEDVVNLRDPILLSLGRLDPRKRLDLLLDAFGRILQKLPSARLRIMGGPGYAPNQLSLIEQFRYRDRVDYRAGVLREQVPSLLREAAVLVQTSENENFGSAVAEALACGVPVVVGPTNGTKDYVDATSSIFDTYAPQAVADAVMEVMQRRRTDMRAVTESTRAAAERWFEPSSVVDRLLEIVALTSSERKVEGRAVGCT